ncbi:MAG: hypothetical protein SFW65_05770 [Alphaproteobacteria bacterium]|nr:hypothetical protein [Alphaproteobacteria bacterium]
MNDNKKPDHLKSMEDEVNEFLQVLAGYPVDSHKLTPLQKQVVKLNNICANIFRAGGTALSATNSFIFGEPDQNQVSRGEANHYEP